MAFRRAVRWTAASTLGVGALAGAQAFACHAWYESPPDATGPTRGVAIPRTVVHDVAEWREGGAVGQGARGLAAMRNAGRALLQSRVASSGEAILGSSGSRRASRATPTRFSSIQSSSVRHTLGDVSTDDFSNVNKDASTDTPDTHDTPDTRGGVWSKGFDENRRQSDEKPPSEKRSLLVYALGDSLVTGAGASDAARGFGPPLPRVFAEVLADATGRVVEWRAFGKKAADVKRIREEVVPAARAAFLEEGKKTTEKPPDVILILCGVNDLKHAFSGRTPEAFRRELRSAVLETRAAFAARDDERFTKTRGAKDVRAIAARDDRGKQFLTPGPGPVVVLPGMPMQLVTAFPPPLSLAAVVAGDVWDEQKRRVAAEETGVETETEGDGNGDVRVKKKRKRKEAFYKNLAVFVPKPSVARMRAVFGSNARLTAEDGVHPNELGYAAWAHLLAGEVAEVLRRRDQASESEKG